MQSTIVSQFRQPHGALGRVAGWIMAHRGSNRRRNAWTVELLDIQPDDRILEFGCGPGLALEMCARQAEDGVVVGLDHSATMLNQARARNAGAIRSGRVQLHLGDLGELPTLQGPFDKVLSANVVQFLPDKTAAYRSLFDVMTPGGVIATTYQPRHRHAQASDANRFADEVREHMETAGYTGITTETLPLQPVPAVCILGTRPLDCRQDCMDEAQIPEGGVT